MNALQGHNVTKNQPMAFVVPSVAANTSAIENAPSWFVHVGRETDTPESARDATFYYLVRALKAFKARLLETEANRSFIIWSIFSRQYVLQSSIALSSESVDEPSLLEFFSERLSSVMELSGHHDVETRPWRGTFHLSVPEKLIFSQEVKLKIADLSRWKPLPRIDSRRLERVNE